MDEVDYLVIGAGDRAVVRDSRQHRSPVQVEEGHDLLGQIVVGDVIAFELQAGVLSVGDERAQFRRVPREGRPQALPERGKYSRSDFKPGDMKPALGPLSGPCGLDPNTAYPPAIPPKPRRSTGCSSYPPAHRIVAVHRGSSDASRHLKSSKHSSPSSRPAIPARQGRHRFSGLGVRRAVDQKAGQIAMTSGTHFIIDIHLEHENVRISGECSGRLFKHGPVFGAFTAGVELRESGTADRFCLGRRQSLPLTESPSGCSPARLVEVLPLPASPVLRPSTIMSHSQNAKVSRRDESIVDVTRETAQHDSSYASSDGLPKSRKFGQEIDHSLQFCSEFSP